MSPAVMLLRHGKSDWGDALGQDLTRPLAKRGRRSAAAVGRFLAKTGHVPDLVLCSPAARARETVDRAIESGRWECATEISESLYFDKPAGVIDMLQSLRDADEVVMLVGHEPTSSEVITSLIGGGRHLMPTAALARIGFNSSRWADVGPATGRLEWLVPSRLLLACEV